MGQRLGGLEEDEIGRGIVEEARQDAGEPEELRGRGEAEFAAACLEHLERHLHGDEDADEEAGDLEDRGVVEPIRLAGFAGRRREAEPDAGEHEQFAQERERLDADEGNRLAFLHRRDEQDHHREPEQIEAADDPESAARGTPRSDFGVFPLPGQRVPDEVDRQQDPRRHQPLAPERKRPQERHASEVSQEEGRIAGRQEGASDVGDEEDEEDHRVHAVPALRERAQQRPDQQHAGSGRPDGARDRGADREEGRVDERRRAEVAEDRDPSADHVEREEQHDERHVLAGDRVLDRPDREGRAPDPDVVAQGEERESERDGEPVQVRLPPVRGEWHQRQHRDREKEGDERHGAEPPQGGRGDGLGAMRDVRLCGRRGGRLERGLQFRGFDRRGRRGIVVGRVRDEPHHREHRDEHGARDREPCDQSIKWGWRTVRGVGRHGASGEAADCNEGSIVIGRLPSAHAASCSRFQIGRRA